MAKTVDKAGRARHKALLLAFLGELDASECGNDNGLAFWIAAARTEAQRQLGKLADVDATARVLDWTGCEKATVETLRRERDAAIRDAAAVREGKRHIRRADKGDADEFAQRCEELERENARLRAALTETAPWIDEGAPDCDLGAADEAWSADQWSEWGQYCEAVSDEAEG